MMYSIRGEICIVLIALLALLPTTQLLAQSNDAEEAMRNARLDATANTSSTTWLAIGCLGGLVGLGVAYVVEPNPPAASLLGKSPEYVAVYTDTYRSSAKNIQTKNAVIGCLVGSALQVAFIVLIIAAEESDGYYY